ncbi:MAG: HdeD family acid-resistance protein [Beijerinckiaceae bacterium]|nr:HdeD family acid-resistance protein [Beijerinckiaceae bacterium]
MTSTGEQAARPGEALNAIVAEHRIWFIALGVVFLILGSLAITFPLLTTMATKVLIGWLFIIGGVAHLVHAFRTRTWGAFFLEALEGVLYLIAGFWLAFFPVSGILTLTIFVAIFVIIQGVMEIAIGLTVRPAPGWGWILFSGVAALIVGGMIISGLPSTAAWTIGVLVGVKLIMEGWAYIILAGRAPA